MGEYTRKADTLIDNTAYARGRYTTMLDLKNGGMNGNQPDWPSYISNTPYVRRNLILRVLATPKGFDLLPEPEKWHEALKALIELHPLSVTGFNRQLSVETRETPYGGAGEMQDSVSNVTRSRVEPVVNYVEKYGRPIGTFYERWAIELFMDPNTKAPNVATRVTDKSQLIDLLPDFTSATIIAFEPDPTFTKIDKAWLVADFKPKGDLAPMEGQRNIHEGGELSEFAINFSGIAQVGEGVDALAQAILDNMTRANTSPLKQPPLADALSGDVEGLNGYMEELDEIAGRAINSD